MQRLAGGPNPAMLESMKFTLLALPLLLAAVARDQGKPAPPTYRITIEGFT